jgi:hypothetical protein
MLTSGHNTKFRFKPSNFASPIKQEMLMTVQRQFSKIPLKNSQLNKTQKISALV